ncbi:MAG: AAA family ATPase [Deltaproteobacteria bacterium]|nr:AAA family ATPase [Deltaproteobacteria bacterium]
MRCASCEFENAEGMRFCTECGASLNSPCAHCGFANSPGAKFCGQCGQPLTQQLPGTHPRPADPLGHSAPVEPRTTARSAPDAERRQLTVMFCDLVGSTALSAQLDPEDLREVVRAYQQVSAEVISRFAGHIAQYLGDGLLVYFGYPVAHEDDAQRAVRAGLGIVEAMGDLSQRLNGRVSYPVQVRIGIHTGLVVVGEMGGGGKHEQLALGDTPNIAARLQGLAEPDTVVLSAATQRLVAGLFECQDLGPQTLKGISTLLSVYRVVRESAAQSRFEAAISKGLMPLVGREEELGLLQRRWAQAKTGEGQVVLLNGEPGIGKSRLVQTLKEHVSAEGATRIEFRCSAYHQNSAFYPLIEHLQRLLQFAPHDTSQAKLGKLQQTLTQYRFPQADTLPLLAVLLSLPQPDGTPPLTLSPQKQKQKTQEALVAWIIEEAEKTAVYCAWEDLHWADPSTLELLTLVLDQVPTTRLLALLTFRPDFTPPWRPHSHITQLTLNRLGRQSVEAMVEKIIGGKPFPQEVVQQIVAKTDGVPLFVEELTTMVLASGLLKEVDGHYELVGPLQPLAIPSTLQDSLMARLDRLAPVRELVQLGATLGRGFSYELLHAVSPLDEALLQQGLRQLVEAELIYQHGLPPQATYLFKHALIQDAAYQSLLKSTRQQYHRQIAQVLADRFPETVETQPELLAHHYTEAGLIEQALPYWQQAGERATRRSANVEAIAHFTKKLDLLKTLPDTPARDQQELTLQTTLVMPLMVTKGYTAPEVEQAYTRARELCRQVGETPQLFWVLGGLSSFYMVRAELQTARELAEQCLRLAQSTHSSTHLIWGHNQLGQTLFFLGEIALAQDHMMQGIALYNPQEHSPLVSGLLQDPGVSCLCFAARALWLLGYPDQALQRSYDALTLAEELSHPYSLAYALWFVAALHQHRREKPATQEWAERTIALATEQGFPFWLVLGTFVRGWTLAEQGQIEEGLVQLCQVLTAWRAMGAEYGRSAILALLAEAYGKVGQTEDGLSALAEALAMGNTTKERWWEAELYRIKGTLTLKQSEVRGPKSEVPNTQHPTPRTQAEAEAEACFHQAIEIARRQHAKSLELRAVMSLARLWQQQGKQTEAHLMLAEIYDWFTEGFDTKDLQEAKALLEELAWDKE